MKKFATLVIEDLLNRSNYDLSDYVLITPGKRTAVFLKHTLSQLIDKPVIAPANFTINEFIEKYSGLDQIETIPAVIKLYEIYKSKVTNPESIEQFWFFGEMLLADFDDIDKYMVDASQLFKYIVDLKEIDAMFGAEEDEKLELIKKFWEALFKGTREHSKEKIRGRFLHFWKVLYPIYKEFSESLRSDNKGYEGMLYRLVAEKLSSGEITMDGKIPVFVGFNALSASEKLIFRHLKEQNALYYWDYDDWYIDDKLQEAGHFMRFNLKEFPNALTKPDDFNNLKMLRQINIVGVPGELEMAQELANEVQENFKPTNDPLTNGIILGDETLLTPVLQSYLGKEKLNVTMGLPIRSTTLHGFVDLLLEMLQHRKIINSEVYYSAKWVVTVLQQPFVANVNNSNLLNAIKDQNRFYVSVAELVDLGDVASFFPGEEIGIVDYLKRVIELLVHQRDDHRTLSDINQEAAVKVYKSLNQLDKQISVAGVMMGQNMLVSLIRKVLSSITITLEGEPLKGSQLMGLIEARTLDFDNLIIVSANEGVLPSSTVAPSFIPYNLRKAYGLLTYEHQDAIFAYYFYRSVQRAKNLTFIYNSNENDNNYGEKSRFLQQMAFELDVEVIEKAKSHRVKAQLAKEIEIGKSPEIMAELDKYFSGERLMYPLQLNTYLNCKLKYYFTYIAGLKEPEKIEPGVDQRIFGLIFHDSMESLYAPFVKSSNVIPKSEIEKINKPQVILEHIKICMQKYFTDIHLHRKDNGMVELIEQVVLRYIQRVLRNDIRIDLFSIPGLEEKFVADYKFEGQRTIKLAGKIDRLQKTADTLWVIDYKTGKSPIKSRVLFENLFSDSEDRSDGAFQAYMYAMIMQLQPDYSSNLIVPSLMYIQDDKPPLEVLFNDQKDMTYSDLKDQYSLELNEVLIDLFSPESSFTQTVHNKKCNYCPFRVICQK
jgi:CRISPR/Cas system-associated exonuclease Cas4 (RecB family)